MPRLVLSIGLALTVAAVGLTLTRHPVAVIRANDVSTLNSYTPVSEGATVCQSGEIVPSGTSAIRLSLFALVGPSVELRVLAGGEVLAQGTRSPGWTAGSVTVPIERAASTSPPVTVCATLGQSARKVEVAGQRIAGGGRASSNGAPLPSRMRVEYLRGSTASWWSSIVPVARRMGLGHAAQGTWVVLLLAGLLAAMAALVWLALGVGATGRTLVGLPRAAWACALVACLNAVSWSFITPPFQAPDEPDHYAYVQQLAETGSLPSSSQQEQHSSLETHALQDLGFGSVRLVPQNRTISTDAEQRALQLDLAQPLSRTDNRGAAGVAASEPPLYYALESIPYRLSGNPLDEVELMRLLSALFAGASALFVFLFLREVLPGTPAAWVVGGLGVALAPLLGFVSGAINPDAMLATVSAALFYCLARGFRRGLTTRLALATALVVAIGLLTKLNFLGLLPGAILGLIVLAAREARVSRRRGLLLLVGSLAIAAAPACVYVLANALSSKPTFGAASGGIHLLRGSIGHELGYVWQLYMPPLPGMRDYFSGPLTTRYIWFDRTVGLYGWLDTTFPSWAYNIALVPAATIAILCARTLLVAHRTLRKHWSELLVYGCMLLGLLELVGADSYVNSFLPAGELYAEPRYLLPMIALMGAALATAALGAGRRWVGVVGPLIVTTVLAHDVFSQLQVIARYYG